MKKGSKASKSGKPSLRQTPKTRTYILMYVKNGKVVEGYIQEVPAETDAVARGIAQAEAETLYRVYGRRGGTEIIEGNGYHFEEPLSED